MTIDALHPNFFMVESSAVINQTTDGSCTMSVRQLVRLVMTAYKRTAIIPSRGVWGHKKRYASASGVLILAFGEFPQVTDQEWLNGFDLGFEQGEGYTMSEIEMLSYGNTKEFAKGFQMGHVVALEIFDWPDAPDIYSKPEK